MSLLKVELVLDLSFLPGHAGDHVVSAWSLLGPSGPFGPPMVVEVTPLDRTYGTWAELPLVCTTVHDSGWFVLFRAPIP